MKIKEKRLKILIVSIAFIMLLNPILISILPFNHNHYNNSQNLSKMNTSDIAGNDLYAEAIRAYVAGNNTLIKHSLFSNDTNLIKNIDLEDPAFYKCNIYLSTSNNQTSDIFPFPLSEREIENQFKNSLGSFIGFLYYDEDLSSSDANKKSERAFEIIKRKLDMDLIHVNTSQSRYYPFIAYYPKWNDLLEKFTENIPKDGYWKAFNIERLSSINYTLNNHISLSYAMINSPDLFENEINFGNDQLDFNKGASISPFLEGGSIGELFEQISTISTENQDLFGNMSTFLGDNETSSTEGFGNITSNFGNFSLSKNSHYSILEIQYEGQDSGIKSIGNNKYEFNLFEALDYNGEVLEPSQKIYVALSGAFLTELDINILGTDIIDTTPSVSEFSDYLLEQLGFILSLTETDFDIETLENYSFEVFWKDFGGLKKNYMNIINLNDDFDLINFLPILGFTGFPSFPAGLLNPLDEYKVRYKIENSEPNIRLTNHLIGKNTSFGAYNTFDFNITAENVGNTTAYGTPTAIPIDLDTILPLLIFLEGGNPNYAEDLKDTLWEIVDAEYPEYNSIEDFFNFDKDPKIFHFDTNGDGSNDYYSPDPFNITNLYPYNENMDNISRIILQEYPQLLSQLGMTRNNLETAFTNQYSVWNAENWELKPGESLSYIDENYDISDNDTYTTFHSLNFTINEVLKLPRVVHGNEKQNTTPSMALTQDNSSWIILSEEYQGQETVEIQFLAQNTSVIDFKNNPLNRFALSFNITSGYSNIELELFNFTSENFIDLGTNQLSVNGTKRTYGLTKYNNSINDIFENPDKGEYTIIFRIRRRIDSSFNITIENINIEFLRRDINPLKLQSTVKYSTSTGNVRYIKKANSITLSTGNMSSVVAYASLSNYNSIPGQLNTYIMNLKNIGTTKAYNITVKIPIPGIIKTLNDFTLNDNYLIYNLNHLSPMQQVKINFTFYVPNSALLSETLVEYNNSKGLEKGNSTGLSSSVNDVFSVAPINYNNRFPYLKTIKLWLNSSTNSPSINEIFNISLNVENIGPSTLNISQIEIATNDQYGNLKRTSRELLLFENISYTKLKSISFSINKTGWKGYFYPAISLINSQDSNTIQIYNSEPLIIGTIKLEVEKSVSTHELEIGELLFVSISIKNIGSICINDLKIDDVLSYSGHFSLVAGRFIKFIDCLNPNETTTLTYTIKSTSEALTTLKGATISYNYLYSSTVYSNSISVKIITPKFQQYLRIIIPSIIALGIFGGFVYYLLIYRKKLLESERKEIKILKQTSRDSILSIETSLIEYLSKRTLKQEGENN
ncbi:MAG: hypothetical protein EU547_01505 [Promethearchaeota archaeon]|nr:MAG: hypothetical protein EU547_01505 [Candidatus Lokiarchaeota archaeon]